MPAATPFPPQLQRRGRRRAVGALAALTALAAAGLWGIPAMRDALRPAAAPMAEADVCIVAPPTPYDPASGLAPTAARAIPAAARCPVCGMFPARSPDWAAQVIFADGDAHFFDSPLSLFMYLQDVARYSPGRGAEQIVAHYVTDAASRPDGARPRWTDALAAFYVHGSSARGPMRAGNLPAFASREAAQAFAAQRGGTVLPFGAIDAALIAELGGHAGHGPH